MPVSQETFDALPPTEIQNINVLKGTTASALYGSRRRNGAIMITTKSAKKNGVSIDTSQSTMFSAGFTLSPKTQKEYGNGSNGKYEFWDGKDGGVNDGDMIWGPKFTPGLKLPQWNSPIRDRNTGEVNVSNKMNFSYPGYNEIITGKADDININSNKKIPNPNISIFEFANQLPEFKNKIAVFGSWDVFPYIFNEERSKLSVNAGYRHSLEPYFH